jgi:hypothetical protein
MDNVFSFRDRLIAEYSSFTRITADDIRRVVEQEYAAGRYWPEPLIQINPNYQRKGTIQALADEQVVHNACAEIFQVGKAEGHAQPLHLYAHGIAANSCIDDTVADTEKPGR